MDRLITLFTNPWFWIIFAPVMASPYLLKYIRRLYPKNIQEKIIQCELKGEEYTKSGFRERENTAMLWGMPSLTILITLIYIFIDLLVCDQIDVDLLWKKYISSAFILAIGILGVFYKKIYLYIFKGDYEKQQAFICDSEKSLMRFTPIFGFLFILLSVASFLSRSCIGEILGMEVRPGNAQAVRSMVPLAEMFGYATDLRSATQGRGVFTMEFDHYAQVTENLAREIAGVY